VASLTSRSSAAGATGTELAAELHRTVRDMIAYGFDRVDSEPDAPNATFASC
jgi:hypothetical protein